MIERMCRQCQAGNPLDAQTCQTCGADLEAVQSSALVRRDSHSLAMRIRQSPVLQSKAAKSIALGIAALAVDVGAALIQKHANKKVASLTSLATNDQPFPASPKATYRRREWQEFDEYGMLRRRVVEHLVVKDE